MAYSGLFRPRHPEKYMGDHTNIVYRSSWEARVMNKLDLSSWCIAWASEEMTIPYVSPVDGKYHRYFPDFLVKYRDKNGITKTMMIEVKPQKQTEPPKPQIDVLQQVRQGVSKKILRYLLSECDYFEVLKQENPFIYTSIKEKIKY